MPCTRRSSTSRSPPRPRPRSIARRCWTGRLVAVKVQRPRIAAKTQADLGVIQELAIVAERRLAIARKVGLADIVGEFAAGVLKELDYRNEAYHARRLADGMTRFPQVHVPAIHDDLSGQRVITMEFVKGIKLSKADELRAAGFDTTELGTVFIRSIIKQVLVDGFFHGDPHPGNVLGDPESQRIVFLDLGLVGHLDSTQRMDLLGLIYAIKETDIPGIGDGLIALGKPTPDVRRTRLPRRTSTGSPTSTSSTARRRRWVRRSGRSSARSSTTACGSTAS